MKFPVRTVLTLAALILIGMLCCRWLLPESSARQKLDALLGQELELSAEPSMSPDWPSDFGSLFNFSFPSASVDVQETAQAYVIRVPLAEPGDADRVQVNVTPGRVEISGQSGGRTDAGISTSSFFQSFTVKPVLPEKMTKTVEKQGSENVLVITIPKRSQVTGQRDEAVPYEEDSRPGDFAPSPFDGQQHHVI
jgi:HSP20 family molecular chaperone IbpA